MLGFTKSNRPSGNSPELIWEIHYRQLFLMFDLNLIPAATIESWEHFNWNKPCFIQNVDRILREAV